MPTEFICTLKASGGDYALPSSYFATESGFDLTAALVFSHGGITGTIGDGSTVTQKVSGATGTCTHVTDGTTKQILVHSITGTFNDTDQIYETIDTNYVTPSDSGDDPISVLEMYDDWVGGLDDVSHLASGTVGATAHYISRVAAGEEGTTGIRQSGAYLKGDSGSNTVSLITSSLEYTKFIGLDVENTRATGSAACGIRMNGNFCRALKCIGKGIAGGIWVNGTGGTPADWPLAETCHAWGGGDYGIRGESTTRTRSRYSNCTSVDATINNFLSGSTNKSIIKNCVGYNAGTADFSANQDTTNSDYNFSSDTSANVFTNYGTGIASGDFNNAAGGDYHLSGTGSTLYRVGTNLSLTTDVDGDAWHATTPSVGFDEVVSAPPAGNPYYYYQYQNG